METSKVFVTLLLVLALASLSAARPLITATKPTISSESDPQALISSSLEEPSVIRNVECESLEDKEYCLRRMMMVAHTDYIYTQDIKGP
ncbi:PREDICTED: phytosulfokines-like [Nelumbo nucifera]|uniref:Phytosulfokine n=2 Tax=Nelumbo nucifera TaxID=4432 RepID=A0A1U8A3C4_NELNU|nr:PREDICTED: phytosulfokines-like [Nelumbo nucifera]DAD35157.1 TPA_asm: hypothetical protein HUJ06_005797 [Nelumbo nucifera]